MLEGGDFLGEYVHGLNQLAGDLRLSFDHFLKIHVRLTFWSAPPR